MRYRLFLAALAGFGGMLLAAGPSQATSYNCGLAALPAEVAICQNAYLSGLDEQMAAQYFWLTNNAPGWAARQIRSQQRAWLSSRNSCGYDAQCLTYHYESRIQQLYGWQSQLGM
jgi:uncharacterized protein